MVPNSVFSHFAVYSEVDGRLDIKRSVANFQSELQMWGEGNKNIVPAILQALTKYPQLGEGRLIDFVTYDLQLDPTGETGEQIQTALQELVRTGKIAYKTNEDGSRARGRGAGYSLVQQQGRATAAQTEVPATNKNSSRPSKSRMSVAS